MICELCCGAMREVVLFTSSRFECEQCERFRALWRQMQGTEAEWKSPVILGVDLGNVDSSSVIVLTPAGNCASVFVTWNET